MMPVTSRTVRSLGKSLSRPVDPLRAVSFYYDPAVLPEGRNDRGQGP